MDMPSQNDSAALVAAGQLGYGAHTGGFPSPASLRSNMYPCLHLITGVNPITKLDVCHVSDLATTQGLLGDGQRLVHDAPLTRLNHDKTYSLGCNCWLAIFCKYWLPILKPFGG